MVARRLILVALFIFVTGAVPALGQDFDFAAVPRVTLGLTNQGPVGAVCASGLLNFSKTTGAGSTTGTLLSGNDIQCQDGASVPISGGSLTLFGANRSVTGTLGDEILFGHALPGGNALIAADTFGPDSVVPFGVGLTALVERHGATFTQTNLTGTWRVVGLTGQKFFGGGIAENFFGTITFFANRSATGSLTFLGDDSRSEDIAAADLLVSANGSVTGVITTVVDGDILTDVTINAHMTPDKTFVVGVTASDRFEDFKNGMFFMQRDPSPTTFALGDLAGSWNVVSLQAVPTDSSNGTWFTGGLTFNTAGNVSRITASSLVDSNGQVFPPVADSFFAVSPDGSIFGQAAFGDGSVGLVALATMSKDKKHIVGVNGFGLLGGVEGGGAIQTLGLFSMVKLGPPPLASVVQFSTGNYSVREGLTATITVNRTGATTTPVTVDFVATDPFVEGSLATGTLSFAAGQTMRTFTVPTFGDPFPNADRVIGLSLSNPTNGATLGARSTANLNVLNDDSTFFFSQPSFTVGEKAGKATITVGRSGGLAFPTSVPFSATPGTAIAGKDFVPVAGNLSFAQNVATAKFDVTILNNSILDGNRSVTLQLFPPLLGRPPLRPTEVSLGTSATLTIVDDDTPGVIKLSSPTYTGTEGTSVVVTILRAPATAGAPLGGNVSVEYFTSNNASAIGGVDYAITSGTVTFTGAETTRTVSVPLLKDFLAEGPEHFLFNLGMPSNGATLGSPSTARVNITDIDKGGLVVLGQSKFTVTEGAGNVSVTVKRTGATPSNASVVFTTLNGTAVGGTDYGNVSTTVSFAANETKTVVIPIFQNLLPDGDRTFTVQISNPQGTALGSPSSAPVTILDDESSIRFAQAAFDAKEGTPGKIVLFRTGALITTAIVPYNISSLSAFPGVDFTGSVSGNVTFRPQDKQQFFMIPTINNTKVDGNRSVLISLGTPTGGAQLGSPSTATFTIVDDDQPGVFRMGSPSYSVKEGGSVVVDIMRLPAPGNGGPLGGNISISYATSNGNASAGIDFVHTSGIVTFGSLDTKKSVTLQTIPDTIVDPGKNFFFTLSAPGGGAALGSPATANVLIQDDDAAGIVFFSQPVYKVSETGGNVSITVLRTGGSANASVHFQTVAGTATSSDRAPLGLLPPGEAGFNDFGFISRTLFFGAGEMKKTVVIPIFDDTAGEGDEVFFVRLTNPLGGLKLGNPSNASVVIVDNEVVIQFNNKFQNNQPVVVRTGPLTANVSVQYMATSGTAILGDDFDLPLGTLVFPPGVSVRTIPIKTFNDNIAEGPETFTVTLMNPSPPAQLGPNFVQVFTLDDNDFGGVVSFSNASPTAVLGQSKPITIVRTGGAGTVMTVGWAAIGGTAVPDSDFSPAAGQVTFLANQSARTFFVNVSAAATAAGKTIVFGLMPPGLDATPPSSKLGPISTSTLTILGTPPSSTIQFSSAAYSVTEDQNFATITVKRTGDLSQPATVQYATSDGTARLTNEDYSRAAGTLTFPATESSYQHVTFTVNVSDDGSAEGPETVNLTLSNTSSNAMLGARATAVLTIHDPVPQDGYTFTILYSGGVAVGLPSINDDQGFAFSVSIGPQTVYSGNMDSPADLRTALVLPSGDVDSLRGERFPVDSGENVAFLANFEFGGNGVVVAFNNSANILYTSGASVGEPALSLNGTLAFKGFVSECMGACDAVHLGTTSGGSIAVQSGDTVPGIGFLDTIRPHTAVNDNATAAFIGTTFGGSKGVFTTGGDGAIGVVSSLNDEVYGDYGDSVSINNSGVVAFIGMLFDGNSSVVLGFDGATNPFVTTSPGGFSSFASALVSNSGFVVFEASFADESSGIFVGPNPVADKVVRIGDIIDGREVVGLRLGGINSDGRISFRATLYDGEIFEDAAIVATPPASCDCLRPALGR